MRAELKRILRLSGVAAAALAAGLAACSDSGPACGAGTALKDGACVATPPAPTACGEGTVLRDGRCVVEAPACVAACGPGFVCGADAACVMVSLPASWLCPVAAYGAGDACDCGCGAPDPDCADPERPVAGCASGTCSADGTTCAPCVPACTGRECGSDGCGGTCGTCVLPGKPECREGRCAACERHCEGRLCGPDGCGGQCGTCAPGEVCGAGTCGPPLPDASCANRCGEEAPSGCSCSGSCSTQGTCCADAVLCGCQPNCTGRTCGDDGCGGICGFCADGERCVAGACADDPCEPDPCGGNGECREPDGTCRCHAGFAGPHCDACAAGYANYPRCIRDLCAGLANPCSGHGECAPATGLCLCRPGFEGVACDRCREGHGAYPACTG